MEKLTRINGRRHLVMRVASQRRRKKRNKKRRRWRMKARRENTMGACDNSSARCGVALMMPLDVLTWLCVRRCSGRRREILPIARRVALTMVVGICRRLAYEVTRHHYPVTHTKTTVMRLEPALLADW